jgi:hypothetical protein
MINSGFDEQKFFNAFLAKDVEKAIEALGATEITRRYGIGCQPLDMVAFLGKCYARTQEQLKDMPRGWQLMMEVEENRQKQTEKNERIEKEHEEMRSQLEKCITAFNEYIIHNDITFGGQLLEMGNAVEVVTGYLAIAGHRLTMLAFGEEIIKVGKFIEECETKSITQGIATLQAKKDKEVGRTPGNLRPLTERDKQFIKAFEEDDLGSSIHTLHDGMQAIYDDIDLHHICAHLRANGYPRTHGLLWLLVKFDRKVSRAKEKYRAPEEPPKPQELPKYGIGPAVDAYVKSRFPNVSPC